MATPEAVALLNAWLFDGIIVNFGAESLYNDGKDPALSNKKTRKILGVKSN